MKLARIVLTSFGGLVLLAACSSEPSSRNGGDTSTGGAGGSGGATAGSGGVVQSGSGGQSATGGAPVVSDCPVGQMDCGDHCADLRSSATDCGACGVTCVTGEACIQGQCRATCAPGETVCDGGCVDLLSHVGHCGACGVACAIGQICTAGVCSCAAGRTSCPAGCVDTSSDPANCGGCGVVCPAGQVCSGGSCAATCQPGETQCGQACVDTSSHVEHCGGCNQACAVGQTCSGGQCICPAGETPCGGSCVDLQTDESHCGSCGTACSTAQSCLGGQCQCAAGETLCSDSCVDLQTNGFNCGSCGNACGSGQSCVFGACVGGTGGSGGVGMGGTGGASGGTGGSIGGSGGSTGGTGGASGGTGGTPAGGGPAAGNPDGNCAVPAEAQPEDTSSPDHVVGIGTAGSCTADAFINAVALGGTITFSCGPQPVVITLDRPAKVFNNADPDIVIDGGGLVTLSGGGTTRILYMNTCDENQVWTTSHCQNQDHPRLTIQNLTFIDADSRNETEYDGGGAIWVRGGRFKVVNSRFFNNTCADVGPDVGGAGIRVFSQYEGLPVYVVNSTFGGADGYGNVCSNGGGISSIGVSWTVINSLFTHNRAIGNGGNPAEAGTPGGGSGGAIYNDGNTITLTLCGTRIEQNEVNAYGAAIFFVSNNHDGTLRIDDSVIRNNIGGSWYILPGISMHDDTTQIINNSIIE